MILRRLFKNDSQKYKFPYKEENQMNCIAGIWPQLSLHQAFHCITQPAKTFYSEHLVWYKYESKKIYLSGWWIERLAFPLGAVCQSLPNKAKILLKQLLFTVTFKSINTAQTLMNQTRCYNLELNCDYEGIFTQSKEAQWCLLSLWDIYDRCSAVKRLLTPHLPLS